MEAATESGEDRDSLLFVSPGLLSYDRPSDPVIGCPWNGLSLVLKNIYLICCIAANLLIEF